VYVVLECYNYNLQLTIFVTLSQVSTTRELNDGLETYENLINALADLTTSNLYTYIRDLSVFYQGEMLS